MRSRFRPHLTSPKSLVGIYAAPWTVPIRLDGSGCPGHRSKLLFVFLGALRQRLWADNTFYCCRKSEDCMSRSWIRSWWAKASPGNHTSNPHPSPALHWQLIPKYVAITHPQHYCGVFSSQQAVVWMLRKENRLRDDLYVRLSPCIISPPAEVQSRVPWTRSGDLMSFLSVTRSSLVGCVPPLPSPLPLLAQVWLAVWAGMWVDEPVIVVFWQQGLYVKKGRRQCVWLMLQ